MNIKFLLSQNNDFWVGWFREKKAELGTNYKCKEQIKDAIQFQRQNCNQLYMHPEQELIRSSFSLNALHCEPEIAERKSMCTKATHIMTVKLKTVVNFINILNFSYAKKITKSNCNYRKAAKNTLIQKLLVKLWWYRHQGSISSTFYIQLLRFADPKSVKRYWQLDWHLRFWELRA